MLSITTDYLTSRGDPEPYLRQIAEAGFTHIHWCHHWNDDFLYADAEIAQIGHWLQTYELILNDVHASEGQEKFWYSPKEYERRAGVELVKNRIDLAARLGSDAIVMHVYPPTQHPELQRFNAVAWTQLRKTLDALEPYAQARGVRIAVENLIDFAGVDAKAITPAEAIDNFDWIEQLFALYPPTFLGLCYDSGHANLGYDRMEGLDAVKDRLFVLHLHDNDGQDDLHQLLFQGTIRWERLAELIATSSYTKPISMEVTVRNTGIADAWEFLQQAHSTGTRFSEMVHASRKQD
jgi:sugar phosphate isomerase/epimerase